MAKPTRRSYSFEFKLALVERFIAGETPRISRRRLACPRPSLLEKWARPYRREGEDGLRPKPKGRPRKPDAPPPAELPELERLRRENERLRAEVAFLGKLQALRDEERR